jgi:hypothetical protein
LPSTHGSGIANSAIRLNVWTTGGQETRRITGDKEIRRSKGSQEVRRSGGRIAVTHKRKSGSLLTSWSPAVLIVDLEASWPPDLL